MERFIGDLMAAFALLGHTVQAEPDDQTVLILTTATFGTPLSWRKALLFTARRRFNLQRLPTIITIVHARPDQFTRALETFSRALQNGTPQATDYDFPGLAPGALHVLHEQGQRGGPIMALERLVQVQAKSIRVLVAVGDEEPQGVYHFDLVGAHPFSNGTSPAELHQDIVNRVVTTLSTEEITDHQVVGPQLPREIWLDLNTPSAMIQAARELGSRDFFTHTVIINQLVNVPAVSDAVASQYSEGCFSTWDPQIDGLVTTVTGSARPVDKGAISQDDLAIILGVRPDGKGAMVRHVEGKQNDPPSSEAVEMMGMDDVLPLINLDPSWGIQGRVPVIRSKLHGHRGVSAFDPGLVEFIPLDPPYYHFPVSCATQAQAQGIIQAFSRSVALQDPQDPRQVAFTILPGHGVVIAEKWVTGKKPFEMIWECMDAGALQIDNHVPQGLMDYQPAEDGRHHLTEK